MKTLRIIIWSSFILGIIAGVAGAQTLTPLPEPRAKVQITADPVWYQAFTPADGQALNGSPYIGEIRLHLQPTAPGSAGINVAIPRAQVSQVGEDLLATDIPVPTGTFSVTATFVSAGNEGVVSNTVPFAWTRPLPPAPRNLRLQVQQP
jgi:hypothetical protein